MLHLVLFEPEIPPNTGNLIRLCANTNIFLHLIEPLGFSLDQKQVNRAGLDYHEMASVTVHPSLDEFLTQIQPNNVYALTTKGKLRYDKASFTHNDALLFGPETRGLPTDILQKFENTTLRLPMRKESRSLNLSNAAAIVCYEALRQNDFFDLS